jgi:hypothetical protein
MVVGRGLENQGPKEVEDLFIARFNNKDLVWKILQNRCRHGPKMCFL